MFEEQLSEKIEDRSVTVAVVGMGYVGVPLAQCFVQAGVAVLGFDVEPARAEALNAGQSYLDHLGDEVFAELAASPRFSATAEMARLAEADAVLVCVPTPLGRHDEPDMSYVESATAAVCAALRPGQLVVLESTTWPGTTREVMAAAMANPRDGVHYELGVEVFAAYSPEREDPGRAIGRSGVPKVVGGVEEVSAALAEALYSLAFTQVVRVGSAEVAEASKLLENIFRAVNIALVNEMKVVLDGMGIDVWEVISAAATKPFGFMPFYPGPGLGGHCIPIDPFYLTWKAKESGRPVELVELAGIVNRRMPGYVVGKVAEGLNETGRAVRGSKVLVMGLAYKPNVADVRESPSVEVIERLVALGAEVSYHDPHVPRTLPRHHHGLDMAGVELTAETVGSFDAVVVVTAHDAVDWEVVARNARLVIDSRNALARCPGEVRGRWIKA